MYDHTKAVQPPNHNLGWFADQAALEAKYPAGRAGDRAQFVSTGTEWYWNTSTLAWTDSGKATDQFPADFREYNKGEAPVAPGAGKVRSFVDENGDPSWVDEDGNQISLLGKFIQIAKGQSSLLYDGTASTIIKNNDFFNFAEDDEFSFMSFFKVNEIPNNSGDAFSLLLKGNSPNSFGFDVLNSLGNLVLRFGMRGPIQKVINQVLELDKYYIAIGVYKGANSALYLNKISVNANLSGSGYISNTSDLSIANSKILGGAGVKGKIEVVKEAIYNLALTAEEAKKIINTLEDDYELQNASSIPYYSSDFSEDTDGWAVGDAGGSDASVNAVNGNLVLSTTVLSNSGLRPMIQKFTVLKKGHRTRLLINCDSGVLKGIYDGLKYLPFTHNFSDENLLKYDFVAQGGNLLLYWNGLASIFTANISKIELITLGKIWEISSKSHGYNTSLDQGNNNHAQHTNVKLSGVPVGFEAKDFIDTITAANTALFPIKAKHSLKYLLVKNKGAIAETVNIGTTSGGNDLASNIIVQPGEIATIEVDRIFSDSDDQDIYLNKSGSEELYAYVHYKKEF